MASRIVALLLAMNSLIVFSADRPAGTRDPKGEIIGLSVGGKTMMTCKDTLCQDQNSPLAAMITSATAKITEDGYYFIDEDAEDFAQVLFFLRHGKLDRESTKNTKRLEIVAQKYCPNMVAWLHSHSPLAQDEELIVVPRLDADGGESFYLCQKTSGLVIGSMYAGGANLGCMKCYLDEYQNRRVHKELCYSWSGHGSYIYNCKTGHRIGDTVANYQAHEILSDNDKYAALKLIDNAMRTKDGALYVCSFNKLGTFSIFNASGDKLFPEQSFATVQDCTTAIRNYVKMGKL